MTNQESPKPPPSTTSATNVATAGAVDPIFDVRAITDREQNVSDSTSAAFFDIDNTVIRGASIYAFARGLLKADIVSKRDMAGFAWKQAKFVLAGTENLDDIAKIRNSALSIVAGREVSEMTDLANDIFDDYMADRLWPGTLALAEQHINEGRRVWLVSATPIEVAQVIADRLGLSGAIATRSEIVDGRYTGDLSGLPVHGQAKADAVSDLAHREGLELSACYAYSDSANDIPMLSLVGNPHAINPDRKLKAYAKEHGWPIDDFRVGRRAIKVGGTSAALAGLAAGATVGTVVTARAIKNARA